MRFVDRRAESSCEYRSRRRLIWEGSYIGRGDLQARSVLLAVWAAGVEAHLGRDQGGEGAALDEAHLDGCGSISINCTGSAGGFAAGSVLGRARRWGCGWRSTVMVVVMRAASFCERDLPLGAIPRRASTTTSPTQATTTTPHRRHVCPPPVNWLPPARARSAPLGGALLRPCVPHILDQRGHSPPPQDEPRRCARRAPQERLDPDQAGKRRRGHETRAGLQRRCRLQDLVRHPRRQPIQSSLIKLAATFRPSPSVSWTAASPVRAWLRLCSLVRPSTSRPVRSGTRLSNQAPHARSTNTITASTSLQRPPHSPATGHRNTGSWTGTCSPRATDGRTRSWAGRPLPTS